jgi:hypothetical protein
MENQWFDSVELQWFDSTEGQWKVFPTQDAPPAPYRIILAEVRGKSHPLSIRTNTTSLPARSYVAMADKATKRTILVGQPPLRVVVK